MNYADLTPELERDLCARWQAGDRAAGAALLASHEGVLWEIVGKRVPPGPARDDSMQNARLGLLLGAKRHDLRIENRLSAYIGKWARGFALKRADKDATISVSRHVVNEARRVEQGGKDLPEHLALAMMMRTPESLDAPMRAMRSGRGFADIALGEYIGSDEPTPEELLDRAASDRRCHEWIDGALACLSEREQAVLRRSELCDEPESFADIARSIGLTRERVRQIHDQAMDRLKRALLRSSTSVDTALWRERASQRPEAA